MANFNEHSLEMSIMELFQDEGYIYLNGEQIHRERSEVLLIDDLRKYLLNRNIVRIRNIKRCKEFSICLNPVLKEAFLLWLELVLIWDRVGKGCSVMIHRQSFSVLWEKVLVFLAFSKEGSNGHDTIRAIIQFGNLHETGFHQGIIDCMVECWRNLHLFGIIMLVIFRAVSSC